jgi:hypothetical protein
MLVMVDEHDMVALPNEMVTLYFDDSMMMTMMRIWLMMVIVDHIHYE